MSPVMQILDDPLASYLNRTIHASQTSLILIFSDHGNNYGAIMDNNNMDARIETYHPSLFLIVPAHIKKKMGGSHFERLVAAQNKLVNLDDARQFLHCVLHNRFNAGMTFCTTFSLKTARIIENDVDLYA